MLRRISGVTREDKISNQYKIGSTVIDSIVDKIQKNILRYIRYAGNKEEANNKIKKKKLCTRKEGKRKKQVIECDEDI